MLLAPKESPVEGGAFGAFNAVSSGLVDVGQGVFDKKVASLRIPVENILSSRDSPAFRQKFRKRNIDISKEELKSNDDQYWLFACNTIPIPYW